MLLHYIPCVILFRRDLICAAPFGRQHGSLMTTWYSHCTKCLGNIPIVDTLNMFHVYNSRSDIFKRRISCSPSQISFSFVLTGLGSADAASPDSHWTRVSGSFLGETPAKSTYVHVCYANVIIGMNACGRCTVLDTRRKPRLEDFAMSLQAGPPSPPNKLMCKRIFRPAFWEGVPFLSHSR